MKAEQRDGAEYEFTVVLDLVHDGHYATAIEGSHRDYSVATPEAHHAATGKTICRVANSEPRKPEPPKEESDPGKILLPLAQWIALRRIAST